MIDRECLAKFLRNTINKVGIFPVAMLLDDTTWLWLADQVARYIENVYKSDEVLEKLP